MALNQLNAWKVAVDIPSGVNGDTGAELGVAFHADLTVTFAFSESRPLPVSGQEICR